MSHNDSRIIIYAGSDISPIIRLKNPKNLDPVDLTDATRVAFVFTKRDRSALEVDNTLIPATQAQIVYESVTFTATNAGAEGNSIVLQFNGVDTVQQVVDAWNTANPSNTVFFTGDDGSSVLSTGTVRLTDGYDAYTPVDILGDPVLGKVKVTLLEKETILLRRGPNQTFKVIIDFGQFPGGTRVKGQFENLDVIDD